MIFTVRFWSVFPSLLILSFFLSSCNSAQVPLRLLDGSSHPYARCLDGSSAGYYYQPAVVSQKRARSKENRTKWVIYLNGGGECDGLDNCSKLLTSPLGSSKYFQQEVDASGWFFASDNCSINPEFCEWNHVFNPYCSQDLHSGQRKEATNETYNFYFSGRHIMTSILDELDALVTSDENNNSNSLLEATEIILVGASAGGIGVWYHVDDLQKRYPKAKVTAATIAGYYFYADFYMGTNHTNFVPGEGMGDFREEGIQSAYQLYEAFVDEDCRMAKGDKAAYQCMLANNSFPYITADSFIIQSLSDKVVLTGHDQLPKEYVMEEEEQEFLQKWYKNMSSSIHMHFDTNDISNKKYEEIKKVERFPLSKRRTGYFGAACFIHTDFSHLQPKVNGLTYQTAFQQFYKDELRVNFQNREKNKGNVYGNLDTCGVMCNPTCPPV